MTKVQAPKEMRLCDDEGLVSDKPVEEGHPFYPHLSYRGVLNELRSWTNLDPYQGTPFPCSGSSHLSGKHFTCTSEVHRRRAKGV